MATAWSLDYCLTCDRQTSGEAYCSQSCRLADLEASAHTTSIPASPTYSQTSSKRNSTSSSHGLYLPPAIDFSIYRNGSSSRSAAHNAPVSASTSQTFRTSSFRPTSTYHESASGRSHARTVSSPRLTPSSSQASLSSLHSTESKYASSTGGISSQARNELREYTNAFDQVRDLRRRMTTS